MKSIAIFLKQSKNLEELYLSWNKIRGLGALCISEAIGLSALRALDLSWNSLASSENRSAVRALSDAIVNNSTLLHLDISNNQLDVEDMAIFGESLAGNQVLIGVHVSGNQGRLDSKGMLTTSALIVA